MKLLLDACVSPRLGKALTEAGFDALHINQIDQSMQDEAVLSLAASTGSILITEDKDFGKLVIKSGMPHQGLIRIDTMELALQTEKCLEALRLHIVTISKSRIRFRPK